MPDRLVLLGSKGGPALRKGGAMPTSSFLELGGQKAVIDCGIGVSKALVEAGESLKDLDLIFITHLHSDHVLELGPLIHTAWTTGLAKPVTIYGPDGIEDYWRHFQAAMAFDSAIRVKDEGRPPLDQIVTVKSYGEGIVLEADGYKVSALRVDHPPVTDCFALKFETPGHRIVFSADTTYFPPLADFAKSADILLHEALLPEAVERLVTVSDLGEALRNHIHASHTKASDVGRIARAAGVDHLILYHLVPADDPAYGTEDWTGEVAREWNGKVTVGYDGYELILE